MWLRVVAEVGGYVVVAVVRERLGGQVGDDSQLINLEDPFEYKQACDEPVYHAARALSLFYQSFARALR